MWIMWITLRKSYPQKKASKIKGLKKLSTFENELSTRYQQVIHCQKIEKVIHIGSYPHCVDNLKILNEKCG